MPHEVLTGCYRYRSSAGKASSRIKIKSHWKLKTRGQCPGHTPCQVKVYFLGILPRVFCTPAILSNKETEIWLMGGCLQRIWRLWNPRNSSIQNVQIKGIYLFIIDIAFRKFSLKTQHISTSPKSVKASRICITTIKIAWFFSKTGQPLGFQSGHLLNSRNLPFFQFLSLTLLITKDSHRVLGSA